MQEKLGLKREREKHMIHLHLHMRMCMCMYSKLKGTSKTLQVTHFMRDTFMESSHTTEKGGFEGMISIFNEKQDTFTADMLTLLNALLLSRV